MSSTSPNSSSSSFPPPSSPVEVEDEEMKESQDNDEGPHDTQQAQDNQQGGGGGGGDEDDDSVKEESDQGEMYSLYPNYNPADHVQESTSTGSCLQYRFYDRSNEDHRRRQPRDLYEYQEKCKILDKKTDFLARQLGRALKDKEELKKRLDLAVGKIKEIKCEEGNKRLNHVDGGKNPLVIFPEEVWKIIFDFVEDPSDLEKCYKTCVTFRNMLKDKKAQFLFPKVFKLVNSKYPFPTTSLLNFRLVSKPCKNLADYSLETRPHLYNFHYLNEHEYNQSEEFRYTFDIDDPTILRAYKKGAQYLEKLSSKLNSISPFPSHHLIIQDKDIPNLPGSSDLPQNFPMGNYRHATFSLLNKLGSQIKFLDIWIHLSFTPETWYNMLYNWLYYTPNVKVLQFKYPFPVPIEDKETADKFIECVNSHPFPNLNKLEMLTLENCPMVLVNSVIKANPQIEQLQILRHKMERHHLKWERLNFGENNLLNGLTNLKKISITIRDDKEFLQFENVNWPQVEIIKTNITINTKGSWERVICWLNSFQGSLTTLIIRLPFEWTPFFVWKNKEEENRRIILNLPKLKKLRIAMRFHTSIDFILGLSFLEDLYVFVDHMDYEEALISEQLKVGSGQIIQFNEFYECMELSNIWDVMPSLKRVYVAVRDKNHGFLICRRYKYRKVGRSGVIAKVNC